jgi:hypothetical protein
MRSDRYILCFGLKIPLLLLAVLANSLSCTDTNYENTYDLNSTSTQSIDPNEPPAEPRISSQDLNKKLDANGKRRVHAIPLLPFSSRYEKENMND